MVERIVATKAANFLIPDARADLVIYTRAARLLGAGRAEAAVQTVVTASIIEGFKMAYGGLWVGGRVELSDETLSFQPNALNNLVHKGDYSLIIPLAEIDSLESEFGVLSGIICIQTKRGKMKMRCFGAKKFLALVKEHCDACLSRSLV